MKLDFLVIASGDPLASPHAGSGDLAVRLAESGKRVGVFLVQNGVTPARRGARWDDREALLHAGIPVQADAFSLRERGIEADRLAEGVEVTDLAPILDALGDGARVLWT